MPYYRQIIRDALIKVISENGYQGAVKNRNIHEQALAHRLALHLETSGHFTGYMIDCEYNRHGTNVKSSKDGSNFRPDIVVHVRGNDNANLIMIEIKKFNDSTSEIKAIKKSLRERRKEYRYKKAFLVIFPETKIANSSIQEIK